MKKRKGAFFIKHRLHLLFFKFAGTSVSYFVYFYARKQLLLSARLNHRNSVYPSVCPSVCLSHGWISQKWSKLRLPNLHHRLPGRL